MELQREEISISIGRLTAFIAGVSLILPLAVSQAWAGGSLILPLAVSQASAGVSSPAANAIGGSTGARVRDVCPAPAAGHASCLAQVVLRPGSNRPSATTSPFGYGPADLRSAYALPTSRGQGQTVAIVDAFDHPNAEADLRHYRATYGLPPCTTANGCFTKIDQRGGTDYPAPDVVWAQEISLDLDMVSAACPNCHILLVEADDNSFENLALAVDQAAAQGGVTAISNSYGAQTSPTPSSCPTAPGSAATTTTPASPSPQAAATAATD